MRFVLGADPHGTGRTEEDRNLSIRIFEDAYILAVKHGACRVVWCGDLLHYKYGLEARLLLAWSEVIERYEAQGVYTVMIPGNHDKPWEQERHLTSIGLLPGTLHLEPYCENVGGILLGHLPWFPPAEFRTHSHALAQEAAKFTGQKFLFSHVPLAEGFVSPSNMQIEQPIRMADLYPEHWDQVFLGDYHAHQKVGPRVQYLGAPIPRTWGDYNNRGYWLLELSSDRWFLKNLGTDGVYPEFHKVTIGPFGPPDIPNYHPRNNYIVHCAANWVGEIGKKYPGVITKPLEHEHIIPRQMRFTAEDLANPYATARRWVAIKGLEEKVYYPIAERALRKCGIPENS